MADTDQKDDTERELFDLATAGVELARWVEDPIIARFFAMARDEAAKRIEQRQKKHYVH